MSIIERSFIHSMLVNKDVIRKTSVRTDFFNDDLSRQIFKFIRSQYAKRVDNGSSMDDQVKFINKNLLKFLAEKKPILLENYEFEDSQEFENAILFSNEDDLDWMYLQDKILEEHKNRRYQDIYITASEKIENGDWTRSDADEFVHIETKKINSETKNNSNNVMKGTDYPAHYNLKTQEIEEQKKNGKNIYYQIPFGKTIENITYVERKEVVFKITETGGGKTISTCNMCVKLAKKYPNDKTLYVTSENTLEKIMDYLHAAYFGVSYREIKMRGLKIDDYLNSLSKEERDKYNQVFDRITVLYEPGIPLSSVEEVLEKAYDNENPYDILIIDAFDNIDERLPGDAIAKADLNSIKIEWIAEKWNVLLIVTGQLKTALYNTSIESIGKNCVHNTNMPGKKSSLMIVVHPKINKDKESGDGIRVGLFGKIVKSRSGGVDEVWPIRPDWEKVSFRHGNSTKSDNNTGGIDAEVNV